MGRYTNHSAVHTVRMQRIPEMEWENATGSITRSAVLGVWQSRDYLAIHYTDDRGERLSVNRTLVDRRGHFRDGVGWDDLQRIKHQCGLGDRWAVEIYPPDADMVNVAAMRHLWLLPEPPAYGWDRNNR